MRHNFVSNLTLLTFFTLAGCSLLEKGDSSLPAGAFRGAAAIRGQTVPLPVEIATDIERITETGEVIRTNADAPEIVAPTLEQLAEADVAGDQHPLTKMKKFSNQTSSPNGPGKTILHKVQKGETLMKISFEKYGNAYRWREIFDANRDVIKDYNLIYTNDVLTIHNVQYMVIVKNGEPYLIRKGDTLKSISEKLYGTSDNWKELMENNSQLIRNPKGLLAGFTMYYRPKSDTTPSLPMRTPSNEEK